MARRTACTKFVQGRVMRATLLDSCGRPVIGDESVVTSKGFISVAYTTVTDEGEEITQTNAAGDTCVRVPARPSYQGESVEVQFCEVDPDVFALLTGQRTIVDYDGNVVGFALDDQVSVADVNIALEVWAGALSDVDVCDNPSAQGVYGYILLPFLQGGVIGDFTIENSAITFTVTGMATKSGNRWGQGPYNVMLDGSTPAVLAEAVSSSEHLYLATVSLAPPAPMCGARPFMDPASPAVTGATAVADDLEVTFNATPSGDDPFWIDFGDGTWDYSDDGTALVHDYPEAGTYTYTVYRGNSSYTSTVTVTGP